MSDRHDAAGDAATGNTGYDEFLQAVGDGEGFYLECPEKHGWLPPRRVCPDCGATELDERPLPETGTVETYSTVHVSVPDFEAETPYTTAIASFGPVRLTGVVRGGENDGESESEGGSQSDADAADSAAPVEVGTAVVAGVDENETTGDPTLTLRPR